MFLSFSYNGKEIKRELNESEHNTSQQWTRGERRTKWPKGKNHASFHSIVFFLLSHFLLSFFHLYLLRLVDSVPFLFLSLQAREGSAWMKEEQEANGRMKWTKRVRYEESTHSPHSTCLSSFHSLTSFLHSLHFTSLFHSIKITHSFHSITFHLYFNETEWSEVEWKGFLFHLFTSEWNEKKERVK